MANILLGTFMGMVASASGQATSVSKLLASYWQGEAPSVAPTPPPPLAVKGNDAEVSSAASDTAATEDTASVTSSNNDGGGGGGGGGGGTTVQDVFLAARTKRSKKNKPAYNRMDREIKQQDRKYRVAVTRNSGKTAVRAAISASAKPALPETSAVPVNARAADWKTLESLRTGPSTCQKTGKKGSSDGA